MGLRIETWNIAYRKKNRDIMSDKLSKFKVISNGHKGWYADPFLYDYNEKTYLFAEYYSYKLRRGIISCAEYDSANDSFGLFRDIITEDYHLSYPVVFEYDNKIYMMPEASQSNALYMYECISFPYEWRKLSKVYSGNKIVDTTPIVINNNLYAFTLRLNEKDSSKGELLLLEYQNGKFNVSQQGVLLDDMSIARPGGNFFYIDDKLYITTQDCSGEYGKAINIFEIKGDISNKFEFKLIEKINPSDIELEKAKNKCGMHTYNTSNDLEVIDLKEYKNSYYRILLKLLRR